MSTGVPQVDSLTFRVAVESDLPAIKSLDELCFQPGDPDRIPAAPGELEHGVASRGTTIALDEYQSVVAYVQTERPAPHHAHITGVAVHPNWRGKGLASQLIRMVLGETGSSDVSVSVVTSPRNVPMLKVLFRNGFIARLSVPDFHGPGAERLYLQHKSKVDYIDVDDRLLIPQKSWESGRQFLAKEGYVLTDVMSLSTDIVYELSRFERGDVASLQSDEASTSVAFAGGVLAAVTFLLGFAFTSPNYPDSVRVLLIGATFASAVSLVIYANGSGEISRLRANQFGQIMKWGNVISEFGGLVPFLIVLPIVFAQIASLSWSPFVVGTLSSLALALYLYSRHCIYSRYPRRWYFDVLRILIAIAPIAGVILVRIPTITWPWTVAVAGILATQAALLLVRHDFIEKTPARSGRYLMARQ